jgi:hypothetical protein
MWAGNGANGTIDTIDMSGAVLSQFAPLPGNAIESITTGPDSNIWFTINDNAGFLNFNPPAPVAKPSLASTGAGPWTQWLVVGGVFALMAGAALAAWAIVGRRRSSH